MRHDAGLSGQPSQPLVARGMEVSLAHLRLVFHLPSEQAAIVLGVTHSRVKRACRRLNLDRWPQRKLASLSLLQGVVEKDDQMPEEDQRMVLTKIKSEYDALVENPNHHLDPELEALRLYLWKMKHYVKLKAARQAGTAPRNKPMSKPKSNQSNNTSQVFTTTDTNASQSPPDSLLHTKASLSAFDQDKDDDGGQYEPWDTARAAGLAEERATSRKRVAADSVDYDVQDRAWPPSRAPLASSMGAEAVAGATPTGLQACVGLHSIPASLNPSSVLRTERVQTLPPNRRFQPVSRVGSSELCMDDGRQSGSGRHLGPWPHSAGGNPKPHLNASTLGSDTLLGWSRPGSNSGIVRAGDFGGGCAAGLGEHLMEQLRPPQVAFRPQSASQLSDLISRLTAAKQAVMVNDGGQDGQNDHRRDPGAAAATDRAELGSTGQQILSQQPQQPQRQNLQQVRQHLRHRGSDQPTSQSQDHRSLESHQQRQQQPNDQHTTSAAAGHRSAGGSRPPGDTAALPSSSSLATAHCTAASPFIGQWHDTDPQRQHGSSAVCVSRQDLPQFSRNLGAPCITSHQHTAGATHRCLKTVNQLVSPSNKQLADLSPHASFTPSPTASQASLPGDVPAPHVSHRKARSLMQEPGSSHDNAHHPGIGPQRVQLARRHNLALLHQQQPQQEPQQQPRQPLEQQQHRGQGQRSNVIMQPDSMAHSHRLSSLDRRRDSDSAATQEVPSAAPPEARPVALSRAKSETVIVSQQPHSSRNEDSSNLCDAITQRPSQGRSGRQAPHESILATMLTPRSMQQPVLASWPGSNSNSMVPDAEPPLSLAGRVRSLAATQQQPQQQPHSTQHLMHTHRSGLSLNQSPLASSLSGNTAAPTHDQRMGQADEHLNQPDAHHHQAGSQHVQWAAQPVEAGVNPSVQQPLLQRQRNHPEADMGTAWQQQVQPRPHSFFTTQQQQQQQLQPLPLQRPNSWQQHAAPATYSQGPREDSSSEVSSLLHTIQQGWSNGASGATMQQQALGMLQALAVLASGPPPAPYVQPGTQWQPQAQQHGYSQHRHSMCENGRGESLNSGPPHWS